jgi:hypothetical protein
LTALSSVWTQLVQQSCHVTASLRLHQFQYAQITVAGCKQEDEIHSELVASLKLDVLRKELYAA